jgi:hypothetical protein
VRLSYTRCLWLAVLVCVPSIFMGIFMDDYVHLLTMDGRQELTTPLDAFRFAGDPESVQRWMDEGPLPWFAYPELHLRFFRPLSCVTMWFDRAVFGEQYWLYHVHSIAWYVALVALAGALFRRFLGPVALVAMALFALDEAHAIPAVWWSNRNALVAAAPALAGLLAHIRWREDGWRWGLPVSLLCYAVGFLGAEVALSIMPYVGAYELLGRRDAWSRRIGALVPAAALSVVYLAFYKWADYGVHGSGIYLDPIAEWPAFLASAPERLLMLLANQFFTLPIEAPVGEPSLTPPLVVISAVVLALSAWLLRKAWREAPPEVDRAVLWLLAGAILSTAPALATFPSGRLMTVPSIGTAAALAMVLQWAWNHAERRPMRWFGRGMVVVHGVLAAAFWTGLPVLLAVADWRGNAAIAASNLYALPGMGQVRQIAVNPPDPFHALYPPLLGRFNGEPEAAGWSILSMSNNAHRITRVDDRTLEVEWLDGEMLASLFEKLVRSPGHPYEVGDRVERAAFTAEILGLGDEGPNHVRFVFDAPLEDPTLAFYLWEGNRFVPWQLPAIGEQRTYDRTRGLFDPEFITSRP